MYLLLRQLLRYLRVVGLDPTLQNRKSKILNFVAVLSMVIVLIPYLIEIVWYFEGFESLKKFDLISIPFWMLFINFTFLLKRQELLDLIALREQFWSSDFFDKETQNIVLQTNRNTTKFIKLTVVTFFATPVMVTGIILWIGNGQTYFLGYHQCTTTICYSIQLAFHNLFIYFTCIPLVGTFDLFFTCLVSEIYCALELLTCSYRNITDSPGDLAQKLKNIVDQHILILRFTKIMDNMHRNVLLFVFFMCTMLFIFCSNIIIVSGYSLPVLLKYGLFPILSLCELLRFCYGGMVITEKFDSISRVVSEIQWIEVGERRVRFGKDVAFILMVAQQTTTLNVSFVIPLNLNTFVKVLKLCYSATTLIAALQK